MSLTRVEIVANRSIEEDLIDLLNACGHGETFTLLHPVFGRGSSGRREASAVWPETNVVILVFVATDEVSVLVDGLRDLKQRFPREGLRCWQTPGAIRSV